ncbi:integral membrane sensor signal transduction histidine kinase [Denitrovibrio acetiphilus DSM 12809]|uniref:histidine kinase n=1 Tax=Denitrovibrio acetiphilus (strain DSM 12809 / NBRC 114555 / N2460) TaxID=522772 RepID=D4H1H1_DENA2|nr:ATP-binding protein [Denitrovibrio acetiphilus]ADD68731.1 integral membrane sensor signal transduction histidine kinase [Denitrovibrio acetiphilus DSM 12809]
MDRKNQQPQERYDIRENAFSISIIVIATIIISYFHYGVPKHHTIVHISHYYAFYLIVIYASYKYGLRGGLIVSVVLTLIYSPAAYIHTFRLDFPHYIIPSIVEVTMVYAVATIAGILSGKLRKEKLKVEQVSCEMLELERKVAHDNRLKAIGQLSAGIAHEIRNPLAAIKSGISLIKSGKGNDQVIDILSTEINHLDDFIRRFLQYARFGSEEKVTFELEQLVSELTELLNLASSRQKVIINYNIPDITGVTLTGDKNAIKQALVNIAINGIEACEGEAVLEISLEIKDSEVIFNITDNGKGLDEELTGKIFEPFFTTKDMGTGLGLALASKIAQQHGGSLNVKNQERGCTFSMLLSRGE